MFNDHDELFGDYESPPSPLYEHDNGDWEDEELYVGTHPQSTSGTCDDSDGDIPTICAYGKTFDAEAPPQEERTPSMFMEFFGDSDRLSTYFAQDPKRIVSPMAYDLRKGLNGKEGLRHA